MASSKPKREGCECPLRNFAENGYRIGKKRRNRLRGDRLPGRRSGLGGGSARRRVEGRRRQLLELRLSRLMPGDE